jgi:hypothetical protein
MNVKLDVNWKDAYRRALCCIDSAGVQLSPCASVYMRETQTIDILENYALIKDIKSGQYSLANLATAKISFSFNLAADDTPCCLVFTESMTPTFTLGHQASTIVVVDAVTGLIRSKFATDVSKFGRPASLYRFQDWILVFTRDTTLTSYLLALYLDPFTAQLHLKLAQRLDEPIYRSRLVEGVHLDDRRAFLVVPHDYYAASKFGLHTAFYVFDCTGSNPNFQFVARSKWFMSHDVVFDVRNCHVYHVRPMYIDHGGPYADVRIYDMRTGEEVKNFANGGFSIDVELDKVIATPSSASPSSIQRFCMVVEPKHDEIDRILHKIRVYRTSKQHHGLSTPDNSKDVDRLPSIPFLDASVIPLEGQKHIGDVTLLRRVRSVCWVQPAGRISVVFNAQEQLLIVQYRSVAT